MVCIIISFLGLNERSRTRLKRVQLGLDVLYARNLVLHARPFDSLRGMWSRRRSTCSNDSTERSILPQSPDMIVVEFIGPPETRSSSGDDAETSRTLFCCRFSVSQRRTGLRIPTPRNRSSTPRYPIPGRIVPPVRRVPQAGG